MKHLNDISRRRLLETAIASAGAALGSRALASAQRKPSVRERAPNILVIMADEHNPAVAGCYGNNVARTPNIDRLAASGVTFDSHYCNSPLCVPSRLSFTSGKYIHRVSAWNNDCRLPRPDYPSLPQALNDAGYESFLCGKQHYDASHRYGFTEIGGKMNGAHMKGRGGRRDPDDTSIDQAGAKRFTRFHVGDDSAVLKHDSAVSAGALDFLSKRTRQEKPFFLFCGYLSPHFPLIVPERYWAHYDGKIPMPQIPPGFLDSLPLNYKHLRRGFGMVDVEPTIVKRGRELYHGLTEWVDEQIGTVLDSLSKSAFADDTVVIYTADHGENLGEHGLWWKNSMYEQSARVPLIVNWPRRWKGGQRRAGACSLVDTVQTIAEIGGARTPSDWNGTSLVKVMDDPKSKWKDLAVSQYYAHEIASGYAMVRSGNWKYVFHTAPGKGHPPERELYNLTADPMELSNLARDAAHARRIETMHTTLVKELAEDPQETELRCRAELAKGY